MDVYTYNTLLSLQHREITPEDYEVLQTLDSKLKPKTLSMSIMEERMPAWLVPDRRVSQRPSHADPAGGGGGDGESSAREEADSESEETEEQQPTCSICLCDLMPGEIARTLPCKHLFHAACIDAWLTENSHVCPADGLPVLPDVTT